MKKFISFLMVLAVGFSFSQAQLVKSRTFAEVEKQKNHYNKFTIAYDAEFFAGEDETITGNGFNLFYNHGFGLTKNIPLFLEAGIGLGFNTGSKSVEQTAGSGKYKTNVKVESKLSNLWLKVPINVSYRYSFGNNMSVLPYTGINFKINALLDQGMKTFRNGSEYSDESHSLFDDNAGGQRFQMGWQIGAAFTISKLYIGLQYGIDFMPIAKNEVGNKTYKTNTSNLAVSLGFIW